MENIIRRLENLERYAKSKIKLAEETMKRENIGCVLYINAEKSKARNEGILFAIQVIKGEKK